MAAASLLSRWLARSKVSYPAFAKMVGADRARIHRYARRERRPSLRSALAIERETGGAVPASYWPTVKLVKPAPRVRRAAARSSQQVSKRPV